MRKSQNAHGLRQVVSSLVDLFDSSTVAEALSRYEQAGIIRPRKSDLRRTCECIASRFINFTGRMARNGVVELQRC